MAERFLAERRGGHVPQDLVPVGRKIKDLWQLGERFGEAM